MTVKKEKDRYSQDNSLRSGDVKELQNGMILETGESILDANKKKFVFLTPYRYNPTPASRYLEFTNIEDIKSFNKRTISSLTQTKKVEKDDGKLTFEKICSASNK